MKIILNAAVLGLIISLSFVCCIDEDNPFEVTVVDPDNAPVAGASIEGGMDWDWYRVFTDSNGVAIVPGHARGEHATIMKDNYFPLFVERLSIRQYIIEPTPQLLRPIGEADGAAIIFDQDNLVTLGHGGDYHVYTYDNQGVTELASAMLPSTMMQFKLFGDILWVSTVEDGIYVFSLADILQPQLLFHLGITGHLNAFAVKDSIVAVGSHYEPNSLRIFSYSANGQFLELASISEFIIDEMSIRDNYLILVGGETSMPTVFDITDASNPILVYNGLEPGAETGIILDTVLVVIPGHHNYSPNYKLVKLTNPVSPYFCGIFSANAWLCDIINNEYAVGDYVGYYATGVLTGNITNGFSTVALLADVFCVDYCGSRPPYFLIAGQLWILEPR